MSIRRRAPTGLDAYARIGSVVLGFLIALEIALRWDALILPTLVLGLLCIAVPLLVRLARLIAMRWTGETVILERIYEHVDDVLGIGRYEARRASKIQRRIDMTIAIMTLGTAKVATRRALRPAYRSNDIQMTRVRYYVSVEFTGVRRPFKRWSLAQVVTVKLHWTSERNIQITSFWRTLEQAVAQALGLPWTEGGLFDVEKQHAQDLVIFNVRPVQSIPTNLQAADDILDEEEEDDEANMDALEDLL